MKQVASIYQDKDGGQWLVQKIFLPRKKGYYTYWTAEKISDIKLDAKGKMFKQAQKADVLEQIDPQPERIRGDSSPSNSGKG